MRLAYIAKTDGKRKRLQLVSTFELAQFFLSGIFCGFSIILIAAVIFRNTTL